MINIKVDIDTSGIEKFRQFSERRLRAAIATSLTRTAAEVKKGWQGELRTKLDRPTPYTTNSVRTEIAKADKLEAIVAINEQGKSPGEVVPAEYLGTQERGASDRNLRKFEKELVKQGAMPAGYKAVPARWATLDSYGNVTRGQIIDVLRQLGGNILSPGYAKVISKNAAKRAAAARRSGRVYLAVLPGAKSGLRPGVYQYKGRELRRVFAYVQRTVYRDRLNLDEKARDIVGQQMQAQFDRAMRESAARIK